MAASTHNLNYQRFLTLMREARERAGVTQGTLGARLGNSQTFVSKIERGERRVDFVEFVEICEALGENPIEILGEYLASRQKYSALKSRSKRDPSAR